MIVETLVCSLLDQALQRVSTLGLVDEKSNNVRLRCAVTVAAALCASFASVET
jgi:hypothetical protein